MTDPARLLMDCEARGIRLLPVGEDGLTIDAPKDVLTSDLIQRLKAHKGDLLAMLRPEADTPAIDLTHANGTAEPVDDSEPEAFGPDGWPLDSIDPDELDPCPECGTLEQWQTMAGNWRCLQCDPPITARRLRERARLQSDRTGSPMASAKADR